MSKSSAKHRRRKPRPSQTGDEAVAGCKEFAARLAQAIELFRAEDRPLWKRTQEGMLAFKGLNMDHLPPRLLRDIDRRFMAINKVLAGYAIKTWEDYQIISDDDLHQLQHIVTGFVVDP